VRRFAAVGLFLVTRSSGVAGLQIALPLFFAIGIVATVIFALAGLPRRPSCCGPRAPSGCSWRAARLQVSDAQRPSGSSRPRVRWQGS
jgi:hypothetical protein